MEIRLLLCFLALISINQFVYANPSKESQTHKCECFSDKDVSKWTKAARDAAYSIDVWNKFNQKRITDGPLILYESENIYFLFHKEAYLLVRIPSTARDGFHRGYVEVKLNMDTTEVLGIKEGFEI